MPKPLVRWLFPSVVLSLLLLSHLPLLSLPFFWDELGQFVPAALDIYQLGAWVPRTTLPNVHPPGFMAYLALVWSICGYSIAATRVAVLGLAGLSLWATWQLGKTLQVPLAARRFAVLLLLVSPLFYTQAMMAQLELPALLFSVLALSLYLRGSDREALWACVALVLMKETGVLVPLLLAGDALRRRRYAWAALFGVLPAAALGAWLLVLRGHTGQVLGNREFAQYNLFYPLHPVRLGAALLRRVYYLFGSSFHWIGALALWRAWRGFPAIWRLPVVFAALHIVEVSVLGGATLERYLLPVLPVLYLAMAMACFQRSWLWRMALLVGLTASLWIKPFYPFPFENNLAFTDFVRLQQQGAGYLESANDVVLPPVSTAWPFSDALRRPAIGYVKRPIAVQPMEEFRLADLSQATGGTLAVYTRTWNPPLSLLQIPAVVAFLTRFYGYEPAVSDAQIVSSGWMEVQRFHRGGQTLRLFRRRANAPTAAPRQK